MSKKEDKCFVEDVLKVFPSLKQEVQNNIYYSKKEFKNSIFRIIIFQGVFKSLITVKKENPNNIKNFKNDKIFFYIENNENIDFGKWDESLDDSLKNVKFMHDLIMITDNQEQVYCRKFFYLPDSKEPENIYYYDTIRIAKERWVYIIEADIPNLRADESIIDDSKYMTVSLLNKYFK